MKKLFIILSIGLIAVVQLGCTKNNEQVSDISSMSTEINEKNILDRDILIGIKRNEEVTEENNENESVVTEEVTPEVAADEVEVIDVEPTEPETEAVVEENTEEYVESVEYTEPEIVEEPVYVETVLDEMARRDGMSGRLFIDDVGVNVAIFETVEDIEWNQYMVDQEDVAVYYSHYWTDIMVADHRHQGFDAIKYVTPGSSVAVIDYGTYQDSFICLDIVGGHNYSGDITDINGEHIYNVYQDKLLMYTCNENSENITIVI